jgi:hypothetical protein
MIILKPTSFLEGHKNNIKVTSRITSSRVEVEYMDLMCFVPEKQKLPHSLQSLTPVSKLGYMYEPNRLISIAITKKESNQLTRKRNAIV